MSKKIDIFVDRTQMLLSNARNHPGIRQQLNAFGFTPARYQEVDALVEEVTGAVRAQEDAYSLSRTVSNQLKEDTRAAQANYRELREVVRFAFRGDEATLRYLKLDESRKTTIAGWHLQAQAFLDRLSGHLGPLKKYGITAERVAEVQAMVQAVVEGRYQWQQRKADAQQATRQRDEALRALEIWVSGFRKIAGVALKDN
ncbi:MAG: hypothetical protein RIG62_18340, partial [Cyclobacteriaceae bacterium]